MFRKISLLMLVLALMFFTRLGVRGQVVGEPYRLSDKEVEQIIHRIENQADRFRHSLDSALDKSRFNDTQREDNINEFVKQFDKETKRLHDHFDHHKSTAADVQTVLERASWIDRFMRRHPLTDEAQNDWSTLRASLDELATAYNVTWGWEPAFSSNPTGLPYRLNDKEVEQILHRIERQADRFRKSLDSALDRSRLNGTRQEDEINAFVKDFDRDTKVLHDNFDHHKSTSSDVESVLNRAARIDEFMRRHRLNRRAQNDWATLRTNLDELAQAYGVTWRWLSG